MCHAMCHAHAMHTPCTRHARAMQVELLGESGDEVTDDDEEDVELWTGDEAPPTLAGAPARKPVTVTAEHVRVAK